MYAPVGQYLRKQMLEHEYKKICIDTEYMKVPGLYLCREKGIIKRFRKKAKDLRKSKASNLGCWKEL
jgi:hypothetical protein